MHSISKPILIQSTALNLPLAESKVRAGFPSPADDFHVKRIDLTEELIKHPQATFLLRVAGDSMIEAGIFDGDMLIVDRAIRPVHGQVVVAIVDGDFTVKYLYSKLGKIRLRAANPTFPEITFKDGQTVEIWGVVTASIKKFNVNSKV